MEIRESGPSRVAILRYGVAVGIVAIIAIGAYAINRLLSRPGEGALRLVPSTVAAFASLDFNPSVGQAVAFKKIDDAMTRNGFSSKLKGATKQVLKSDPAFGEIEPYLAHGVAMAMLPDSKQGGDPSVTIVGTTDPKSVEAVLKRLATPVDGDMPYYHLKSGMNMAIIDGNLVASTNVKNIRAVGLVASGQLASVTSTDEYREARAALDPDSNLMIFVNAAACFPGAKGTNARSLGGTRWLAYGFALRDQGIAVSMRQAIDPSEAKWSKSISGVPPLRKDLANLLPGGAYGFTATSQPGVWIKALKDSAGDVPDFAKSVSEFESNVQKTIGLDIDSELVPALKGDGLIAAYPKNDGTGLDLLFIADDSNGANPAAAIPKFRAGLEKSSREAGNKGPLFEDRSFEGAKGFQLSEKGTGDVNDALSWNRTPTPGMPTRYSAAQGEEIGKAMQRAMDQARARHPKGDFADAQFHADMKRIADRNHPSPVATLHPSRPTSNMVSGVFCATVGNVLVVATSEGLLNKAVQSCRTGAGSAANDSLLATGTAIDGQQSIQVLNISRIGEGIRKALANGSQSGKSNGSEVFFDFMAGLKQPVVFTSKASDKGCVAKGFIPMDYDKLIDMIGKELAGDKPANPGTPAQI